METNKLENESSYRKRKIHGLGFGLLLILFGTFFLLLNTGVIPAACKPVLISWQMLLIACGVWGLLWRHYVCGIILIVVGGFFIYPVLCTSFPGYFGNIALDFKTLWPALLIAAGVIILLSRLFPESHHSFCKRHKIHYHRHFHKHARKYYQEPVSMDSSDYINKSITFSGSKQIILSSAFKGGSVEVTFGSLIIDLRKATLAEGENVLNIAITFGSCEILVPSNWVVEIRANATLGVIENQIIPLNFDAIKNDTARLIITGDCVLGSTEIK
ncbi:MAG: cell wall-active antibiotics response protein [Bacteroidales bacterium]|jgi:predicted membrane protein|nr:cell wall-active antibiotics response protein [Bacteroidales bacterium]